MFFGDILVVSLCSFQNRPTYKLSLAKLVSRQNKNTEHRLREFERKILSRIFRPKRELSKGWRRPWLFFFWLNATKRNPAFLKVCCDKDKSQATNIYYFRINFCIDYVLIKCTTTRTTEFSFLRGIVRREFK